MFNKKDFASMLKKINELYENQTCFSQASGVNRTYLSQYMNLKLDSPPSPKVLNGIATASKGTYSYMDLMQVCGYINYNETDIKEELENKLKYFNLTEEEYNDAINCFMYDSKKIQSLALVLKFSPNSQNNQLEREKQILLTIINYVFAFIPNDLEISNDKNKFYSEFDKALIPAKKMLLSLDKNKIINTDKKTSSSAVVFVYGTIPAGVPIECIEDIIDTEEIPADMLRGGKQYFGLKVKGDSMEPDYLDGDTLILLKQDDCENGDDCVVMVNGNDGTFKRVFKNENGIILQPLNNKYSPMVYSNEDIEKLPVRILGIVDEIRRKKRRNK